MQRIPIINTTPLTNPFKRIAIPFIDRNTTIANSYELLLASLESNFNYEIVEEDLTEEESNFDYEDINPECEIKLDELDKQMILESVAYFADSILTGPIEPPYNGRFLIGDHHLEWDELIAYNNRICILSARDHGKSYFFDFAYPIRQAIKYPGECGFIFSATQSQASEFLEMIKIEIETNPKLQYLVPKKKSSWGSKKITLANGHRIYARGFGVRVRGAHPRWIVVDDGLNDETAWSETVRNKQNDYFFNAISNMVTPSGQIIVVGTPFHINDLYGELQKNKQYVFKMYPAESNPGEIANNILWPDRYSLERLLTKKDEIGLIRYGREFLVSPISDEMSLFPISLFRGNPVEQFSLKLGMPLQFWLDKGIVPYAGVDFAISSTVQADYTVIIILGLDNFGNRWLIDMFRKKGLPYREQQSEINRMGRIYDPGLMTLEANQMQRIFGDELIRETDLPIYKFVTTAQNKNSLEFGVPELRVLFENGKFRIPRGDAHSIELTDILIDEFRSMTFLDGRVQSVGQHDDTVLACWLCNQAIKRGAFGFSFGDDVEIEPRRSNLMDNVAATDSKISNADLEEKKKYVINNIKKGNGIICNEYDYPIYRDILHEIAGESIDGCSEIHSIIALQEIKRLDDQYNFGIGGF